MDIYIDTVYRVVWGFPGGSDGKEATCQCRRPRFDPWVGKIPCGGNDNPLQYRCLGVTMDGGAWPVTVNVQSRTCLSN